MLGIKDLYIAYLEDYILCKVEKVSQGVKQRFHECGKIEKT